MTTPRDDIAGLSERLRIVDSPDYGKNIRMTVRREDVSEAATQLDSLLKERDALQARVKELESGIAHAQYRSDNCDAENQSLYNRLEAVESRALRAEQERDVFEAQLPDGMKHCTITFHECEKGHGWLSATNWIDNGCLCCQRDEAYERLKDHLDHLDGGLKLLLAAVKADDPKEEIAWRVEEEMVQAHLVRRLAGPEKEKKE